MQFCGNRQDREGRFRHDKPNASSPRSVNEWGSGLIASDGVKGNRVSGRLKILSDRFSGEFPNNVAEIESLWERIGSDERSGEALDALYRLIHRLAGAGETFGYPQLSKVAQRCERTLFKAIESGRLRRDDAKAELDAVLAELSR